MAPSYASREKVDQERGNNSTESQPQVGVPHGLAASFAKPAGDQNLIGDGASQHVTQYFHDAETLVLPKLRHRSHEEQRRRDEAGSGKDHEARTEPINEGTG